MVAPCSEGDIVPDACIKTLNLGNKAELARIRQANIAACLAAMIEERRFTYTDIFKRYYL